MNIDILAFDSLHHLGESATHPLIRLVVRHKGTPIHYGLKPVWSRRRLPLYPQGVGRIRKAAEAATAPLSLLVAGPGLPPRRFAAVTRPNAPSGASNCGF